MFLCLYLLPVLLHRLILYLQAPARAKYRRKEKFMDNTLSKEQIAHDLAVAYVTYQANKSDSDIDLEPFVRDYVQAYAAILGIVERTC